MSTPEERVKYFGAELFANVFLSNVRGRANRGRRDDAEAPEVKEVVKLAAEKSKESA